MTPEQDFFKLIAEKTEFLKAITPFLFGGGGLVGVIALIVNSRQQQQKRKRQQKIPSGDFSFEVIPPHSETVLKQLMPGGDDKDPLADFNIPYLQRQPDRNVRQEIERAFEEKPWVLILGQSGLGKTREASHLAELLNDEGWTVLNLADQPEKWLDVPRQFPSEISPNAKLLFFVDDLNRWVYEGNPREISKDADDPVRPLRVSVHERLLRVLEFFERECRNQVRVIATARNEQNRHPDRPHEPSECEKLQFEKYPDFWNRFYRYELAEPSDESIVQLLSDRVAATNLQAKSEEYSQIARRNDKTFRNIVENLRTAKNRNLVVSVEQLSESLDRTWRLRYNATVKRYPTAKHIYDAIEVLRVLNLWLKPEIVEATAKMFIRRRGIKWLWTQWELKSALRYLVSAEKILEPRDGQIEAKGSQVDGGRYISQVLQILCNVGRKHYSQDFLASEFFDCGNASYRLERYEEAITSYDRALQIKPDKHEAWYNRGLSLNQLGHHEEAITSYDRALQIKLDTHEAWNNRGLSLANLGCHEEAITSYDRALQIKPDTHEACYNKACCYALQSQTESATANLKKAIELNPEVREWAKTDSDFDSIRQVDRFQALINAE
jgi:tetratricopeptide (TPR) repeat protein